MQRCILRGAARPTAFASAFIVCPRCGGPLEIELPLRQPRREQPGASQTVGGARASRDPRDLSGVWRYRELLPFDDAAPFVTLFEGNTPLYDAPRSAKYCGVDDLRLKHQGAIRPAHSRIPA